MTITLERKKEFRQGGATKGETAMLKTTQLQDEMTAWRHDFHRRPELQFDLNSTSDLVVDLLASFGLEVHRGLGQTGVIASARVQAASRRADGYCFPRRRRPRHER